MKKAVTLFSILSLTACVALYEPTPIGSYDQDKYKADVEGCKKWLDAHAKPEDTRAANVAAMGPLGALASMGMDKPKDTRTVYEKIDDCMRNKGYEVVGLGQ